MQVGICDGSCDSRMATFLMVTYWPAGRNMISELPVESKVKQVRWQVGNIEIQAVQAQRRGNPITIPSTRKAQKCVRSFHTFHPAGRVCKVAKQLQLQSLQFLIRSTSQRPPTDLGIWIRTHSQGHLGSPRAMGRERGDGNVGTFLLGWDDPRSGEK
jgi:hypothetical protein